MYERKHTEGMEGTMKTLRWTLWFTGGVLIALGLWSMTFPMEALLSLALWLGAGVCLSGINYLLPCFSLRGEALSPRWFLFLGLMDLAIGGVMLTRLGLTAIMIPIVVSLWLAGAAVVRLVTCIRLRWLRLPGWWFMLLSSLTLLACACMMFFSPFLAGISVVMVLAGALVVAGVLIILEGRVIFR